MERVMILGDQQARYDDRFAERVALKFQKDFDPTIIVNLGDLIDNESISKFSTDSKGLGSLADDRVAARAILQHQRAVSPNAKMFLIEGNHEARLRTYVLERAPAFQDLPELKLPNFLGLDDLDIKYIGPYGNGLRIADLFIYHGMRVNSQSGMSARNEREMEGGSGVSGHTQRGGSNFYTDRRGVHVWYENFCMCNIVGPMVPPSYRGPKPNNWQQGFTFGYVDRKPHEKSVWTLYQAPIVNHKFIWAGKEYDSA